MFWGRGNCNILSYILYIIFSLTVCLMKEIISFQFTRTRDTFWTVNKRRSCSGPALQKLTFRYRTVLPLIFSPTTRPEQDTHSGLSVGHTKKKGHSSSSGYAILSVMINSILLYGNDKFKCKCKLNIC